MSGTDRMPQRKHYEDGLELWRVRDLRDAGILELMRDKRQLLITPEGRELVKEHRGIIKTVGREMVLASQFTGTPDERLRQIQKSLPWEHVATGTLNNVYRRRKDDLDLSIKMNRPDPQYDVSEVPDNAVQTQLLRLMRDRFGVDVVETYFVTPDFCVMEFVEAPLTHEYVKAHPEMAKSIYDQLWRIEKMYPILQREYFIPRDSDIKSLRRDTSNSFVIEDADGSVHPKLFDIGLGIGSESGFPLPGQTRVIRQKN